ncbi:MAG TPA: flavodoxin family protein [Geobacteraceae bacterium]
MKKVLVTYHSLTGNTAEMARMIADGLVNKGLDVTLKRVEEVEIDTLSGYDGFVVGSPNYFGTMSWQVKKFVDESVKFFRKLDGKAAAAFTSAGMIGGGGETVVLDILKAFLVHGCVVQGLTSAGHYGPVAVGKPDERVAREVGFLVEKFASLVAKL